MNTNQKVRRELITLSARERASLAHELILSLDDPANNKVNLWQKSKFQRRVKMGH